MDAPNAAFEMEKLLLNLDQLLPVRSVKSPEKLFHRYPALRESISEVGLVEPLVVYRDKRDRKKFVLIDGHMRYAALRDLGITKAECIVATEDEAFTYNAKINRLSPIQEHQMIKKAVKNGVPPERIAKALKLKLADIMARMNLLDGINSEAAELLKDKQITAPAIGVLRKVSGERQIEMAELMVSGNNFSKAYTDALFLSTSPDQLLTAKTKEKHGLTPKEIARMESEMATVEQDFKGVEESYGTDILQFTLLRTYVRGLMENRNVANYLNSKHREILTEIKTIVAIEHL